MNNVRNTSWSVLDQSHQALVTAVRGIDGGGEGVPTPCALWNVAQVVQHAAGDQLGYAAAITGTGGPTFDPFAPSGEFDEDPRLLVERCLDVSAQAWSSVDPAAAVVPTPLPHVELSPAEGAAACALDAAIHAWDIAVATGRGSVLTDELADDLAPVAHQIVEPLRAYGVYAARLEAQQGDGPAASLLRFLGRNPQWVPPVG